MRARIARTIPNMVKTHVIREQQIAEDDVITMDFLAEENKSLFTAVSISVEPVNLLKDYSENI